MPAIAAVMSPGVTFMRAKIACVITVEVKDASAIKPAPRIRPTGVITLARIHNNIVPAATRPIVPIIKVTTGRPMRLAHAHPSAAPPSITKAASSIATTGLKAPVVSSSAAASSGSISSLTSPAAGACTAGSARCTASALFLFKSAMDLMRSAPSESSCEPSVSTPVPDCNSCNPASSSWLPCVAE